MIKLGAVVGLAVTSILVAACSSGQPEGSESEAGNVATEVGDPHVAAGAPRGDAPAQNARVRLERAQRQLDRGEAKAALSDLESLAEEGGSDDQDEVLLALSRAHEANGDLEGAIEAVESLLIAHTDEDRGAAREAAEKRLRFLMTGSEEEHGLKLPPSESPPPVTRALAQFFEPNSEDRVVIDVYAFGIARGNHNGIFDIAEAKRQDLEQDLGSKVSVGQSISSAGSWVSLPRAMGEHPADMPQADRSMLVFYYDLGDNKVPSRYDDYLPMPSDEIAAILERGDGVIVAKKRDRGKPTIVIAAPRPGQMNEVELAFAQLKELPYEPLIVPLADKLTPREMQQIIRSKRREMRDCYDGALKRDGKLEGKFIIDFRIAKEGHVMSTAVGEGSTLRESTLDSCLLGAIAPLQFPASGEETRIRYPLVMNP